MNSGNWFTLSDQPAGITQAVISSWFYDACWLTIFYIILTVNKSHVQGQATMNTY